MKEIKHIVSELKKLKVKRLLIQFPEGLKYKIQSIVKTLEQNGLECVICLEPCFGACDVKDDVSLRLGCNAILHIGHSGLGIKSRIPVVYWEWIYDADPIPILKHEMSKLRQFKKIGLVTNLQFVGSIKKARAFLEMKGKEILTHKALSYEGQVLGCNIDAGKLIEKQVDAFLFLGAGKFHALGLALKVNRPVLLLDFEKKQIYDLKKEKLKFLKLKEWCKASLKDAKKVGVLISWKKGQLRHEVIQETKQKLEKLGKEVYLLAMDTISPEKIEGLKLDLLVNLACPRIGIDDLVKYKLPIINFKDIQTK